MDATPAYEGCRYRCPCGSLLARVRAVFEVQGEVRHPAFYRCENGHEWEQAPVGWVAWAWMLREEVAS